MMRLRYLVLRAIRSLGYDVRRVDSPRNLSSEPEGTHPITLEYCPSRRGYAVFDISLEDCRGFHSFGLPLRPECHPFVRAFGASSADGESDATSAIRQVLDSYYASVRPISALEVVDLSGRDAPGLEGVPPIAYVLPWWETGVSDMGKRRQRSLRYVAMRYGMEVDTASGHTFFGPASASRISLQVTRLAQLLESVQMRGFRPFARDFPTKAVALLRGGEYRWLIQEGQHRFALAGALHVKAMPAVVTEVVRREDAPYWPQVVSGVFTQSGALELFDRVFVGLPPRCCGAWISQRA